MPGQIGHTSIYMTDTAKKIKEFIQPPLSDLDNVRGDRTDDYVSGSTESVKKSKNKKKLFDQKKIKEDDQSSFGKFYIIENLQSFEVTIKDVEGFLKHAWGDQKRKLEFIYDKYEEYKNDFEHFFRMYTEEGRKIINYLVEKGVPYIDMVNLKLRFLTDLQEFPRDKSELYPMAVYVSSGPKDRMTIGFMVYEDGKLEMFEGNDEATPETLSIVNKLLHPEGKKVKIYANHNEPLVDKIKHTGILPKGLFVSPNREVASSHWGENRVMFSGIVNINDFNRIDDVDWMTLEPTKIENVVVY